MEVSEKNRVFRLLDFNTGLSFSLDGYVYEVVEDGANYSGSRMKAQNRILWMTKEFVTLSWEIYKC